MTTIYTEGGVAMTPPSVALSVPTDEAFLRMMSRAYVDVQGYAYPLNVAIRKGGGLRALATLEVYRLAGNDHKRAYGYIQWARSEAGYSHVAPEALD